MNFATFQGSLDALQGVDAVRRALRAQPSRARSDGSGSPSDDGSLARFLEQGGHMPRVSRLTCITHASHQLIGLAEAG